ncbi:hypothetical protein D8B26_003943 [Coccidioides posadasii str. Silveira]|uniref:uncharacterized protein n=1 Tax=Coccidioides posadasii (strain RMSCC 757 / Silveira) TaxID=443226 RepID=UPI001BEF7D56|nr:hypothetical protein D8B26_003943 [Coccidioides posadasii str. Silveira]
MNGIIAGIASRVWESQPPFVRSRHRRSSESRSSVVAAAVRQESRPFIRLSCPPFAENRSRPLCSSRPPFVVRPQSTPSFVRIEVVRRGRRCSPGVETVYPSVVPAVRRESKSSAVTAVRTSIATAVYRNRGRAPDWNSSEVEVVHRNRRSSESRSSFYYRRCRREWKSFERTDDDRSRYQCSGC